MIAFAILGADVKSVKRLALSKDSALFLLTQRCFYGILDNGTDRRLRAEPEAADRFVSVHHQLFRRHGMSNKKKPLLSAFASAMIIITLLLTVFNIAAWYFPSFMDVYHRIYAPAATFISRLPGFFPFSVGEILIAAAVIISVLSIVLTVISAVKKNKELFKAVSRTMAFILVFVYFTETCNCFVLFHTTELTQRLAHYAAPEGYSTETLVELCRSMIKEANELALVVERDSDGNVIPPADLSAAAEDAFSTLYEDIPELKGYCAAPKKMIASTLMTQMDLQGVYFPFTLEGNYNGYISPAHVPTTTFHEIAHIKGFIREDEATFLSCAACLSSDIPEVRYSGCTTCSKSVGNTPMRSRYIPCEASSRSRWQRTIISSVKSI